MSAHSASTYEIEAPEISSMKAMLYTMWHPVGGSLPRELRERLGIWLSIDSGSRTFVTPIPTILDSNISGNAQARTFLPGGRP